MPRMPRSTAPRSATRTRLATALREPPRPRATPLDLYALARRRWLAGERVDVGALAARLQIGRATAFRWVGSRELLLGEILWALCDDLTMRVAVAAGGRGAARIAAICEAAIRAIIAFEPLRRFVRHDPEYALRLLTSKAGVVQARAIERVRDLLREEVARGALQPPLKVDTLAYLLVRLCESFIYAEVVSDQQFDVADAGKAVQLLLSGRIRRRATGRAAADDSRVPRPRRRTQAAASRRSR
jgi:hypothetical protein